MKEKINVCLMNDSFPPLIDGVANTVVNYASIIEEKYGHAIVSTPDYPGVTDDYPFEVMRYPSLDTSKFVGYSGPFKQQGHRYYSFSLSHCLYHSGQNCQRHQPQANHNDLSHQV